MRSAGRNSRRYASGRLLPVNRGRRSNHRSRRRACRSLLDGTRHRTCRRNETRRQHLSGGGVFKSGGPLLPQIHGLHSVRAPTCQSGHGISSIRFLAALLGQSIFISHYRAFLFVPAHFSETNATRQPGMVGISDIRNFPTVSKPLCTKCSLNEHIYANPARHSKLSSRTPAVTPLSLPSPPIPPSP